MVIESVQNPQYKELMRLKTKKGRKETGLFLVEGVHLVGEAIKANRCVKVIGVRPFAGFSGPQVLLAEPLMKRLADLETSERILAVCRVEDQTVIGSRVLLLDGIQDPGNLGTLIRSAKAFGFDTLIAENTVDRYNSKVVRATQGALFGLNYQEGSLLEFVKSHPDMTVIGTSVTAGLPLATFETPKGRIALLLGNEGQGVRPALLELANPLVTIEMMPQMESLNVAVAGSILMYHLRRKEDDI